MTKPMLYIRYVDDIFVVLDDIASLQNLESKLSEESALSFRHEIEKDGQLIFLDCVLRNFEEGYRTSVHVKNTRAECCLNYRSICLEKYKVGVIKTLLCRG